MNEVNNEELFRSWLQDHRGIVVKVATSFTSAPADRDDLIQEILLQIWAALPSFQGQSKPSTWIYRIALNRALTWSRDESRRRHKHVPFLDAGDAAQPDDQQQELWAKVYEQIRGLKEIDRSLILMSLDGCTYQEMADVLGITESNVGARLSRAKQQLSKQLAEYRYEL